MYRNLLHVHDKLKLGTGNGRTDKESPKKFISMVYDPCLGHLRTRPLRMIEIGVRGGGSTKLWLEFFEEIELFAIDNGDEVPTSLMNEMSQMEGFLYLNHDAYKMDTLNLLLGDFDVIIDDGPHTLESMKFVAKHYTKKLSNEGILFIEDVQASHWIEDIVNATSLDFKGCIRVADLRSHTGVSDALIVVFHKHLEGVCNLQNMSMNYNKVSKRIISFIKIKHMKYLAHRIILKLKWKLFKRFEIR